MTTPEQPSAQPDETAEIPAAAPAPAAADGEPGKAPPAAPAAAPAPSYNRPPRYPATSRARRFFGSRLGVGVVVALLMLLFVAVPAGVVGFVAGRVSADHGVSRVHYGRMMPDDGRVGPGQRQNQRNGGRQDGGWVVPGKPAQPGVPVQPQPASPSASPSAS